MLPAKNRLKTEKDISRLVKSGRSCYARLIGLRLKPNGLAESRFGFAVGTKISKKSTVRNLLKRRLREIIRSRLGQVAAGFDVLVVTKPGSDKLTYRELEAEIAGLLPRAGLMRR
jgi:ribonuclease P protein component